MKPFTHNSLRLAALLALLFACPALVFGQVNEHAVKVAYIYKFTHYVQWPNTPPLAPNQVATSAPFVIGVLGNTPLTPQLERLAQLKKVAGRPIVTKKLTEPAQSADCQVVFVADAVPKAIRQEVVKATANLPVMIVGESSGLAQEGAPVNFFLDGNDGTVGFEINVSAMKGRGFRVDPKLLKLAEIVP